MDPCLKGHGDSSYVGDCPQHNHSKGPRQLPGGGGLPWPPEAEHDQPERGPGQLQSGQALAEVLRLAAGLVENGPCK